MGRHAASWSTRSSRDGWGKLSWPSLALAALFVAVCCAAPSAPRAGRQAETVRTPEPAAWRAAVPKPGTRGQLRYPRHREHALPSGLELLAASRPAGVVSLSLVVRAPAADAAPSGSSAFLTRMLTEGTASMPGLAFAEAVENLGTEMVSSADRDATYLSMTVLPADLEAALQLMLDAVARPELSHESLERVRGEWLAALIERQDDPSQLAALVGLRELWGAVHGPPVQGVPSSIRALTVPELRALHGQYFTPDRSALVVVGEFDEGLLLDLVERASAGWSAGATVPEAAAVSLPEVPEGVRVLGVNRHAAVQTALFVAQRMPPRATAGYEARLVLNTVLGGLFTSRINQNLREVHAFTYGAFSSLLAAQDLGAWMAMTSVETRHTTAALGQLLAERSCLGRTACPNALTASEVDRARAALVARVGAHLQSADRIAGDLRDVFVHELPSDYYQRFDTTLAALDVEEIAAQGRAWFGDAPSVIVAVGDTATFSESMRSAGYEYQEADVRWLQ